MQFDLAPSYLLYYGGEIPTLTPEEYAAKVELRDALTPFEPGIDMEAARKEIAAVVREAVLAEAAVHWRMQCAFLELASSYGDAAKKQEAS